MPEVVIKPEISASQHNHSVWFSSATAALIASLEAVNAKGKWVAVPPNVCPNVLAAIFGAECKPWFVDIEPERQGIDPKKLGEVIADVAAVIAVHTYGVPCLIDQIADITRHAKVPLIEDCAQADGAFFAGQEVGTFGDIAVFSFGKGKIVEAGGGGMAIVQHSHWQEPMFLLIKDWDVSAPPIAGEDLGSTYRFFYNQFYPDRTHLIRESFYAIIKTLAPAFKTKCQPERIATLGAKREAKQQLIMARREKYFDYQERLAGCEFIKPVNLLEGTAPWRFNAVVNAERRNGIFRHLLAAGMNVSTWYPRISEFLPAHAYRATDLPVSRYFEETLLNLWVDESASVDKIVEICDLLKNKSPSLFFV